VTEHFTSAQIANWRRRNLAPAELLTADDHLAGCVECRRLVESALDNDAMGLYAGLAEGAAVGQHLSFDQSAAYVDGLLTGAERRMIEDHLASCARCAPLATDLRAFRNEIAKDLEREYRPRATAEGSSSSWPSGWLDRVVAGLPSPLLKIPSWIYASAALSLLAAAAWMAMSNRTPPQTALTSPTPTTAPSVNAFRQLRFAYA
jgi:hypothetical protein